MKLASKVLLLFLLAFVAITGIFSYLTIRQESDQFAREHERHAADLLESIRPQLLNAWKAGGHRELAHVVRVSTQSIRHTKVQYYQYDASGADKPTDSSSPEIQALVGQKETVTRTVTDRTGNSRVHTVLPLNLGDQTPGGIDVSSTMEPVEQRTRETLTYSALSVLGVAALCSGLLVVFGVRMIGRPLDQLVDKTKRVGLGDLGGPLNLNRNDELGQLATALNEMCDQLAQQRETIHTETASRRATEQQLRHADRLKTVGRLATGIAHELGTPLNVVSGRAGLIAGGKLSDSEIQQSAVVIKTEADRIAKVIRELLDFARRSTPQRSLTDLREVIDHSVDLLQPLAETSNVAIRVESTGEEFQAHVDAGQLQQVLTNLLMNAVQSIDQSGEVEVRLTSGTATPPEEAEVEPGDFYRIDVIDNGCGIAEDRLHDIFEPFYTTKDVGEGTGLGLSISYGIIREHGGWIAVTSEVGEGSRFSVYLPKSINTKTDS